MKFIDLSLPLEDDRSWAPRWMRTRVTHQNHRVGRRAIRLLFGLGRKYLKTGLGWANDQIQLSTHGTTHVDAPWHYGPLCGGLPAATIDQVPLERFYGPGVVLDLRHLDPQSAATTADVQEALTRISHQLSPGEIVLIRTGNDQLFGERAYFSTGPGVSAAATRWLIEQGIFLMGIDAWGWDAPLAAQAREARRTGRRDLFWEAHYVGTELEYCQIERLAHLDQLPPTGFTVCAFPLKVRGGSAGPARVVAMVEESPNLV